MSSQDFYIKKLLKDLGRFADLYNAEVFHGKQILKPEQLTPLPIESGIVITDRNGKKRTIQRRRDIAMMASLGACFVITDCEAQSKIHYAMPVRQFTYDALDYTEQLTVLQNEHKKRGDLSESSEFLSGITTEDKLIPILNLVVYCGKEPWNGPKSLLDMFDLSGISKNAPEIYTALPNYQIHVVDIRNIEDLELYQTGLQQVFGMLKYNNNKSDFHNYILSNRDAINLLDDDALTAAIGLLGENRRLMKLLSTPERKEKGTMCQAIDELIEDGRLEGKIEGSLEGELRMANLISILLKENRLDLLAQITSNETLRKRLFQEYNL